MRAAPRGEVHGEGHDAVAPRRFRRGATARAHTFGLASSGALYLPAAAGRDWSPVLGLAGPGLDGGIVVVFALALVLFAWPSLVAPGNTPLRHGLLAAAFAVASSAPFLGLAHASATGRPAAGLELAAGLCLLAVFTFLGRVGGRWVGAFAFATLLAATLVVPRLPGVERDRAAPGVGGPARLVPVQVELVGPLESATVRVSEGAPLRLFARLAAGESRRVGGWLAVPEGKALRTGELVVSHLLPAAGEPHRIRVVPVDAASDAQVAAAPFADRGRPAPPPPARRSPPAESLLIAWTVLFAVTAVGGRMGFARPGSVALACLALGLAGGWLCFETARPGAAQGAPRTGGIRVFEGRLGGSDEPLWVVLDRATPALAVETASDPLESGGWSRARVSVSDGCPRETRIEVGESVVASVHANPGAAVEVERELDALRSVLRVEVNAWDDLDAAWTRGSEGLWTARGPWRLGQPGSELPRALEGGAGPPAWSIIGVPSGARAIIGRVDGAGPSAGALAVGPIPGRVAAPPPGGSPSRGDSMPREPAEVWVRVVQD